MGEEMERDILEFVCEGMIEGGKVPVKYTGRGENISPRFTIANLSVQAETLAVTLEDLSHPIKNFTHWVVWNIPATDIIEGGIPAGKHVPALGGAKQGIGYGFHRYAGPKPPKGKTHRYRFTLYALDTVLDLTANVTKRAFLKKSDGHILQKGCMTAEFG